MIDKVAEIIVYGFAAIGFAIVFFLALGATLVATDGELRDRREQAQVATRKLEMALHRTRQPEHILLPAMVEE